MKRSAVALGFRSLTANLHPKVPLSVKESQKLLTVINASFRKHLDEVHPWSGESQTDKQELSDPLQNRDPLQYGNPSSSALADRHLASVLTSPLFTKSGESSNQVSKVELFKQELSNHPGEDPLVLLQHYNDSAAECIPLASLCLDTVRQSLRKLGPEFRHAAAAKLQAGHRILHWLQQHKSYEALNLSQPESRYLLLALVRALSFEGNNELIWNAITGNHRLSIGAPNDQDREHKVERHQPTSYGQGENEYRKFMLFALVKATLSNQPGSMNAALDIFSKACNSPELMLQGQYLLPAARLLVKEIRSGRHASHATDELRHDRFMDEYSAHVPESDLWKSFDEGSLRLCHPTRPSVKQATTSLVSVLDSDVDSRGILAHFGGPKSRSSQLGFFTYVSKVVAKLQEDSDLKTASVLMIKISGKFPAFVNAPSYEILSRRQHELQKMTSSEDSPEAGQNTGVLPFATFGRFASDH